MQSQADRSHAASFVSPTHLPWALKRTIYDTIGYKRFGAQEAFHKSRSFIRIFAAGNQSGKSHAAAFEVLPQLMYPVYDGSLGAWRGRRGWVVVPRYSLADPILAKMNTILQTMMGFERKRSKHGLELGQYAFDSKKNQLVLGHDEYDDDLRPMFWIKSADEPAGLHAQPLDWVIIDEAALIPFEVVQVNITPRLTQMGGWWAATGTFEDTVTGEWFVDYWRMGRVENDQGIQSFQHRTADNPYSDKDWLEVQKARYAPRLYAARYEAIPMPNDRLVFPDFNVAKHVDKERAEFDPERPVYLGIDPGGYYAVGAYQIKWDEEVENDIIVMIDEVYSETGGPTSDIAEIVKSRPWFKNVRHHNDGRPGAIDIAAAEAEKVWDKMGIPGLLRYRVRIEVGNDMLRNYISTDRFYVHPRCRNMVYEMSKYAYPEVRTGRDSRSRNPVDQDNHLIKSTIYFIRGIIGPLDNTRHRRTMERARPRGIF